MVLGHTANVLEVYAAFHLQDRRRFDPEDGGSVYHENISNIAHNHMMQRPLNRNDINN
jgi:hypothetical protein